MYVPPHFAEHDPAEMRRFVQAHPFGTLTGVVQGLPVASHIPFLFEDTSDGLIFTAHVSVANPLCAPIRAGERMLAAFLGPHTYISPSWYDQPNVPTWNYQAVHVYGVPQVLHGEALRSALRQLMAHYEAGVAQPMSFDEVPEADIQQDLRGLLCFRFVPDTWQGAYKLSQNRNDVSHARIVTELRAQPHPEAQAIAEAMYQQRKNR